MHDKSKSGGGMFDLIEGVTAQELGNANVVIHQIVRVVDDGLCIDFHVPHPQSVAKRVIVDGWIRHAAIAPRPRAHERAVIRVVLARAMP